MTYKALMLICLLTVLAYSNTINGEFQFDDDLSVIGNSYVTGNSRLSWDNLAENAVSGVRPFTSITFALNYRLGGLDSRWFHITNLAIHLFSGLLLFVFVLQTFRSPKLPASYSDRAEMAALISSALFLLHPIQTEAVSYISQRSEALASMFYLCALIAYAEAVNSAKKINSNILYSASVFCYLFAIGSKEIAVTIPALMLMYDFYFLKDRPLLKRMAFPGVLILLSLIAGIYILANMGRGVDAGFSVRAFTPVQYLLTQFRVIVTYLHLLVLPINQNIDYDFRISRSLFDPGTVLSLLFILGLLAVAAMSYRKWRTGSFFILWFFIIIAPTSSIIPIIDPIYEHRVYLASAGFFVIFTDLLSRLILTKNPPIPPLLKGGSSEVFPSLEKRGRGDFTDEKSTYNKISVSLVIILMVSLAMITFQRNRVWQTKLSLWQDAAMKSPEKSRPHNNLGNCYMLLGDNLKAIEEYKKAIAFDKKNIEAYFNLGINLDKVGRFEEAVFYYDIFSRNAPPMYDEQRKNVMKRINEIRQDIQTTEQ